MVPGVRRAIKRRRRIPASAVALTPVWRSYGCDLRLMNPPYDKTEKEIIDNFEIKFKSKMQECAVLIVHATTNDSEKWTIAGFSDAGEFRTVVIDDSSHELSQELKKEPRNESRIVKLASSSLGRTRSYRLFAVAGCAVLLVQRLTLSQSRGIWQALPGGL